jgi:hypothetical protein
MELDHRQQKGKDRPEGGRKRPSRDEEQGMNAKAIKNHARETMF